MKKQLLALTALAAIGTSIQLSTPDGALYSNTSGAPSSGSCTGCHGGTDQFSNDIFLEAYRIPVPGGTPELVPSTSYQAGATYLIVAGVDEKTLNNTKFGFALSATRGSLTTMAGETSTQKVGTYITHTSSGTTTTAGDGIEWAAMWTAPSTASNNANFQLYLNAADNNGSSSGDVIYSKTLTLTPGATGVKTIINEQTVTAYPNPVTENQFAVNFELNQTQLVTISLFGVDGRLIETKVKKEMAKGSQTINIPVDVNPGIYFVKIEAGDQIINKRILVK